MSHKEATQGWQWFLAGLGFGALLGVLFTPRSGRETREGLLDSAEEGRAYIRTRGKEAREVVDQWVERDWDARGTREATAAGTHGEDDPPEGD